MATENMGGGDFSIADIFTKVNGRIIYRMGRIAVRYFRMETVSRAASAKARNSKAPIAGNKDPTKATQDISKATKSMEWVSYNCETEQPGQVTSIAPKTT